MTLVGDFVTGQTVPFQRLRQLLADGGLQEGVVGAGDLLATQRAAGANMSVDIAAGQAWVRIDTGTRNGLSHVTSDAVANVVVGASHASLPRLDQIVLRYNDTAIPTGSGNTPTYEIVPGTATAGVTLDNRTNAAALPNDCMRIADILVPGGSTSVITGNIRDRRPWARGAFFRIVRTAGDYNKTATSQALVDSTNLQPRVECSGVPLRVTLSTTAYNATAATTVAFDLAIDNTQQVLTKQFGGSGYPANMNQLATLLWGQAPVTAGSHLIGPMWAVSAGTGTLLAGPTFPLEFTVEEIVRPNASNT